MRDVVDIAGCVINYVPVVLCTVGRSDEGREW